MSQIGRLRDLAIRAVLAMLVVSMPALAARSACPINCTPVACSDELEPVRPRALPHEPILEMLKQAAIQLSSRNPRGPSLFLSGGGSHGAWGAGVLYGRQLNRSMPRFDLITGVSTGALMGTLVLIEDYAELKNLYTNVEKSDVQESPVFTRAFGRALYSREPLRKLMECVLDEKIGGITRFDLVKEQMNEKRRLMVGTVDLNTGKFCNWDMTCIACNGDRQLYVDVVMASANAPAIGPPEEIAEHLHVDGGVRAQIFAQKVADTAALGSDILGGARDDAYFLVNGKIEGGVETYPDGWEEGVLPIVPIAVRGLDLLQQEALALVLHFYHQHLVGSHGIYLSRTPKSVKLEFKKRDFDRDQMVDLFEAGCLWGKNMTAWPQWKDTQLAMPPPSDPHPSDPYPPTSWPPLPAGCEADAEPPEELCTEEP